VVREVLEDELVIITPGATCWRAGICFVRATSKPALIMHEEESARAGIDDFVQRMASTSRSHGVVSNRRSSARGAWHRHRLISRKVAKEEIEQRRLVALSLGDSVMKRKFFLVHHATNTSPNPAAADGHGLQMGFRDPLNP